MDALVGVEFAYSLSHEGDLEGPLRGLIDALEDRSPFRRGDLLASIVDYAVSFILGREEDGVVFEQRHAAMHLLKLIG